MGEWLGLPEWLALSVIIAGTFLVLGLAGWRNTNRQIYKTLAKRENLTRDQFVQMMSPDVSREASYFLWESATPCLDLFVQDLTLHPEDHLVDDLPIDDEEWSLDWPRAWAEQHGFHESNLPDWPEDWPATVRNFGRWLDLGPQ